MTIKKSSEPFPTGIRTEYFMSANHKWSPLDRDVNLDSTLSQFNPLHVITTPFLHIYFNFVAAFNISFSK
jgi:hypothetical protein